MTAHDVRASFLAFFARHNHRIVPSSPLVPANDPTLLFTNAGMNQFKDVFLGLERRDYRRAASSQKCMRVSGKHNDLESVGPSLRHHTFFEMLGNFSFGDYFKTEAIELAWTLLTKDWGIPPDRLYATIFGGDEIVPRDTEAYDVWRKFLPAERISEMGAADNFWAMGETGPCGRCSEIHYFRGDDIPCSEPTCQGLACTCDRFVEVWNNVFMEFDRRPDGSLHPLPAPSIDTGMGLERVTAVLQGRLSNYDTDLFAPLLARIGELAGRTYGGAMTSADISMRVVADHLRATCFLIADGVVPSNEWRGYVLRKIMRRAMRHGRRLGLTEPFLYRLVEVLAAEMGAAYPQLVDSRTYIEQLVRSEEERFESVLVSGLPRLEELLDRAASGARIVPGDEAFRLYETFGVPLDFIEDLASERHLVLDREGFDRALAAQRNKARTVSTFGTVRIDDIPFSKDADERLCSLGDHFEGYDTTHLPGVQIVAIFTAAGQLVSRLQQGETGFVALSRTPFYAEAGGQVSDTGWITAEDGTAAAIVTGLVRPRADWPRLHHVQVTTGTLSMGEIVTAEVAEDTRHATERSHTATHLLHAALRQVLGAHVKQAGSLVAPDRLRFDFVHHTPLTADQIEQVERLVNMQVRRNAAVVTTVQSTSEAMAAGAMALFGEKYGDTARVVSVPGFSLELCGGTHARATGDIGFFIIVAESGIAAGVRRIEALAGEAAVTHVQQHRTAENRILGQLNVPLDQASDAIERLQSDVKHLSREVSRLKVKLAMGHTDTKDSAETEIDGVVVIVRRVDDMDKARLRDMADSLKARHAKAVVVLASTREGKVSIVVSVTRNLASRLHAGHIVKQLAPLVGGGGGGREDFAEAGGKDPQGLDELVRRAGQLIREQLSA